jgi:hypothetical protein
MPEELLHVEQAHTALDEPGREGVPEGVIGGATVPFYLSGVAVAPGPLDRAADRPGASAPWRILVAVAVTREHVGRVAPRRVAPLHDLAQPPRHRQHGRVAGLPPIEVDTPPAHDMHHLPEHGFGKPEERAYNHAMEVLGVGPDETWMVGDNLEWEIVAPQRLGICAI